MHSTGLDTSGPQSTPGLRPLTASTDQSVGGNDTSTPAGETPAIGFDAPYVSDLRFLALPGIPASPTTTTPTDTTTTTPAAPVGPPPEIEDVHTTALTPFSATIAWRTSVPASSRIAYGLDAPVIWTPASGRVHRASGDADRSRLRRLVQARGHRRERRRSCARRGIRPHHSEPLRAGADDDLERCDPLERPAVVSEARLGAVPGRGRGQPGGRHRPLHGQRLRYRRPAREMGRRQGVRARERAVRCSRTRRDGGDPSSRRMGHAPSR